jgi:hypothetical protein
MGSRDSRIAIPAQSHVHRLPAAGTWFPTPRIAPAAPLVCIVAFEGSNRRTVWVPIFLTKHSVELSAEDRRPHSQSRSEALRRRYCTLLNHTS